MHNPPASNSKHFSCNLPFFGTANRSLSFKRSGNKDMLGTASKVDLDALSFASGPEVSSRGRRRTVEDSRESEVFPLLFPFVMMGVEPDIATSSQDALKGDSKTSAVRLESSLKGCF